jgi:AraC family ethanolamine operon transcriptional activator
MDSPTKDLAHGLPNELREVSIVRIMDPTAVGDTVEVLDQDMVNLDNTKFEAKRITVPLEDSCLMYQWTNVRLRTRTKIHDDFDACSVLGPHVGGSINGSQLRSNRIIAAGPGATAELIVDSGYESVTMMLPPQVLDRHLALRRIKRDFVVPEVHEIWQPDAEAARNHFILGKRIAEAAEESPQIFNDSRSARHGAQVEFMDSLLATIESCQEDQNVDTDKKGKSYSQIVRSCEDYTLSLEGRRPYLSELCATANASERTLQYAFKDIMGMSPLTYLHRLRLHRARDELRKAQSGTTTVTDVALNWGFWHFGEFSRAYKNCFGEVPSKTLGANSDD